MTLKKKSNQRRANLPRRVEYTKGFIKDWERIQKAGKLDMNRLKEIMILIFANDGPLGPEWSDHELNGEWENHRECHVGGDFLLIYQIDANGGVVFVRTGKHTELFE